jgi:Uncharacterized protein conserved in bacteria
MPKGDLAVRLTPIAAKLAAQFEYELVDVSLDKEPHGMYLRIYLDKPEGITLDDCEKYHRALMPQVEDYDYDFLEVSSPGIDQPLKTERDFERHMGDEIEIRFYKPQNGKKILTGILADFVSGDVIVQIAGETMRFEGKAIALVKPIVDMEGVETVDLSDE